MSHRLLVTALVLVMGSLLACSGEDPPTVVTEPPSAEAAPEPESTEAPVPEAPVVVASEASVAVGAESAGDEPPF